MRRLRGVAHEILDAVLATVLRGGWGATVSQRIGLQGGIRLHELTLSVRRPPGSPPLCVGFASDFHAGPATHPKQITLACERLSQAHPDVVLLGGDFVSLSTGALENVCAALGSIPAPLGRFAVLGNHDYRRKRATAIAGALEHNGIRVLRNANVRLGPPHDDVWICGLDDVELGTPDACCSCMDPTACSSSTIIASTSRFAGTRMVVRFRCPGALPSSYPAERWTAATTMGSFTCARTGKAGTCW